MKTIIIITTLLAAGPFILSNRADINTGVSVVNTGVPQWPQDMDFVIDGERVGSAPACKNKGAVRRAGATIGICADTGHGLFWFVFPVQCKSIS